MAVVDIPAPNQNKGILPSEKNDNFAVDGISKSSLRFMLTNGSDTLSLNTAQDIIAYLKANGLPVAGSLVTVASSSGTNLQVDASDETTVIYDHTLTNDGALSIANIGSQECVVLLRFTASGAARTLTIPSSISVSNVRPNSDDTTPLVIQSGETIELSLSIPASGTPKLKLLNVGEVVHGTDATDLQDQLIGRYANTYVEYSGDTVVGVWHYNSASTKADDGITCIVHTDSGARFIRSDLDSWEYDPDFDRTKIAGWGGHGAIAVAPGLSNTGTGAWKRVMQDRPYVKLAWFCKPTDTPNTQRLGFQAACDFLSEYYGSGTIEPYYEVTLNGTVVADVDISIIAGHSKNNCVITAVDDVDSVWLTPDWGKFLFYLNTTDGLNPVENGFTKSPGAVYGIHIDNSVNNVKELRGFCHAGGYIYVNVAATGVPNLIKKINDYQDQTGLYDVQTRLADPEYFTDQWQGTWATSTAYVVGDWIGYGAKLYRVMANHTSSSDTTDAPNKTTANALARYKQVFQINLGESLGDNVEMNRLAFTQFTKASVDYEQNGIDLYGCRGGVIRNITNGHNRLQNCTEVFISSPHCEGGTWWLSKSSVTLQSLVVHHNSNVLHSPIVLEADTSGNRYSYALRDVVVQIQPGASGYPVFADIQFDSTCRVNVANCYRRLSQSGAVGNQHLSGITFQDMSQVAFTDWNNYSHLLSERGAIVNGKVTLNHVLKVTTGTTSGLASAAIDTTFDWEDAAGTFYYKAQYLLDPIRMIGRTGTAEVNASPTLGGGSVKLQLAGLGSFPGCMVRIYRGTSTGSYNKYVDVPWYDLLNLYDFGSQLNGYNWISRTAGAADTVLTGISQIEFMGDIAKLYGTTITAPSAGSYKTGDVFRSRTASAGQTKEITCIVAGTAGVDAVFFSDLAATQAAYVADASGTSTANNETAINAILASLKAAGIMASS